MRMRMIAAPTAMLMVLSISKTDEKVEPAAWNWAAI